MTGPIVFLDIDGVLNRHEFDRVAMSNRIEHSRVELLNGLLDRTGAMLVLSSAWRYIVHRGEATLAGFDWLLRSHGVMCGRLVGLTRPDTMMPATFDGTPGSWPLEDERGRQIADWRSEHGHRGPYVVLDDGGIRQDGTWSDLGIVAAGHPFVRIRPDFGLRSIDVARAAGYLAGSEVPS